MKATPFIPRESLSKATRRIAYGILSKVSVKSWYIVAGASIAANIAAIAMEENFFSAILTISAIIAIFAIDKSDECYGE